MRRYHFIFVFLFIFYPACELYAKSRHLKVNDFQINASMEQTVEAKVDNKTETQFSQSAVTVVPSDLLKPPPLLLLLIEKMTSGFFF